MATSPSQPEKLRADLDFLRGAFERQRHFHRQLMPLSLAVMLGLYIFSLGAVRDLAPSWRGSWLLDAFGYVVLIALVVLPWLGMRRRGDVPRCNWTDAANLLLPWAGLIAASILLYQIGARLDLPARAFPLMLTLLIALTAFVSGLGRSPMLIGVGLSLGAGLGAQLVWPQFGWFILSLLFCLGLIGGAFIEHRAAR